MIHASIALAQVKRRRWTGTKTHRKQDEETFFDTLNAPKIEKCPDICDHLKALHQRKEFQTSHVNQIQTCQVCFMYHYTGLSAVRTRTEKFNLNYGSDVKEWQTFECVPSITKTRTVSGADKAGLCQRPVNEDKRGGGGPVGMQTIIQNSLSPCLSKFCTLCYLQKYSCK